VIRFIVASAAEAELGALFHNCQMGMFFCSILKDMGHIQPKTPVHFNATAVGIANSTVKRQWSRSMEMRFFSGLETNVRRKCTHFTGIQDKRILRIIRANITQVRIMQLYTLGICMSLILRICSQGRKRPAL
jgi:hypothetical protein